MIKSKKVALAGYQFDLIIDTDEEKWLVVVEKVEPIPPKQSDQTCSSSGDLPG